jgi:hypothetical protein
MDTVKIRDLIAELEGEISVKVNAIKSLKALLASSNGASKVVAGGASPDEFHYIHGGAFPEQPKLPAFQTVTYGGHQDDSYVDLAVAALETLGGKPMRMVDIFNWIKNVRSNPHLERRSVEATISQHVKKKGEKSRIIRVSPGIYGLRRYPRTAQNA